MILLLENTLASVPDIEDRMLVHTAVMLRKNLGNVAINKNYCILNCNYFIFLYKYIIRSIVLIFPEVLFQNGQSWYWFNTSKLLEMKITSKDTVSVKGSKFLEKEMKTNTVTN